MGDSRTGSDCFVRCPLLTRPETEQLVKQARLRGESPATTNDVQAVVAGHKDEIVLLLVVDLKVIDGLS